MSAALAAPNSPQGEKVPAQHLRKSLEHRGGRKGRPLASPGHFGGPHSSGWDGTRRETHWLRLPQSWQEVCGAGPKRVRADWAAPRWPSSSPPPAPGSQRRSPTHPALPNHRQFRQNSRSFLNSRCRLHGRPYELTQGFTNSTVSMQSGKWWGGWPSLAGCSARTCV